MFEEAKGYGWTSQAPHFDWKTLIANKDAEIDRLNGVYIRNLKNAGAEIFDTRAVLKDAHTIHLVAENRDVTAEKILIATGGAPWTDASIEGHDLAVTSNEAFHLEEFPRRVVIAGGGYIAIEFACIFRGLGAEVTLVYRGDDVLRNFDRDISVAVHREMQRMGIRVLTRTVFTKIEKRTGEEKRVHLSAGAPLDADLVFWAVGRKPATGGMGLEAAGVALGKDGAIIVDEWNRTSVANIFAVGDVTDRVALTPVAIREGAAFAETEFNNQPVKVDYDFIPKAVFSQPPVGTVGYSEGDARKKFGAVDVYKTDFRPMKNTLSGAESRTYMKLVVEAKTDRVLGVHIVGEGAPGNDPVPRGRGEGGPQEKRLRRDDGAAPDERGGIGADADEVGGERVMPSHQAAYKYFHLVGDEPIGARRFHKPFGALVLIESGTSSAWRTEVCRWLIRNECCYAMCWGADCAQWHLDLDLAEIEVRDEGLFPVDHYVMTTWHEDEPLAEVFWFAQNCAYHPDIEFEATYVFHIASAPNEDRIATEWRYAQSAEYLADHP